MKEHLYGWKLKFVNQFDSLKVTKPWISVDFGKLGAIKKTYTRLFENK